MIDERRLALFPAGTIVRNLHHRESSTSREQDLNLRRTWKLYGRDNHYFVIAEVFFYFQSRILEPSRKSTMELFCEYN